MRDMIWDFLFYHKYTALDTNHLILDMQKPCDFNSIFLSEFN